jgi:hypothetical protein
MQNLTLAELESELAIRKATAAFEAELRKGDHVCLHVLFELEREAGYTPEQNVTTLLNYADAHGWGVGPSVTASDLLEEPKDKTLGEILGDALEATPKEPESIPDWEYYGFPDEESYTPGEGCGVEGCCK